MAVETTQGRYLGWGWGRFALGLGLVAVVSGCGSPTATINPNFSRLSFGYLNSGMASLGRLYLVDTKAGSLSEIGVVPASRTDKSEKANYEATQVSEFGVTLSGTEATSLTEAEVAAVVQSKTAFQINAYVDESYGSVDDDITAALRAQVAKVAAGGDSSWEIDTVLKNPDLVYLLVFRAYAADDATLTINQSGTAGANAGIVEVGSVKVEVKIAQNAQTKWSGSGKPAVIEFIAFRPRLERTKDGTEHIRFRRYGVKVPEDLPKILRQGPH